MEVAGRPIPPELAALLERFHFERVPFEQLRAGMIAAGDDLESMHRISEPISAARDVAQPLPAPGSPDGGGRPGSDARSSDAASHRRRARGGMATRFGSQVKALARSYGLRPGVPRPQMRTHASASRSVLMTSRPLRPGQLSRAPVCDSRRNSCRCA
jgi:hypothetical protein